MKSAVTFDIEYNPDTDTLNSLGVFIPSTGWTHKSTGKPSALQDATSIINHECQGLKFVVGHNIIEHDIKKLRPRAPDIILCSLPAVDTLYLSPLAFPRNPYHRLVKGYKLVKDSINDPVADARLSWVLLQDCIESFAAMDARYPRFYGYVLASAFPGQGFGPFFESVTGVSLFDEAEASAIWADLASDFGCSQRAREVFDILSGKPEQMLCLAYALAWLSVAGGNSVVPAWVRHRMPEITGMLDAVRGHTCGDPDCVFCVEHHDIHGRLKTYFGYDSFRPVKEESPPLQEQAVRSIMSGENCLAILPTGAGKSLCYQLPALMRAEQRNLLTLVISPLQSLMKDQVDGLKRRGIANAATINGMLTPLERTSTLEGIRSGSFDLVWIAPEQLRNTTVKKTLAQRELGLVVIDEAHCLSRWGHDFRPDYMHIAQYLKKRAEKLKTSLPQIACFTATAKLDVIQDIEKHFREKMDVSLKSYKGGHERTNLHFDVMQVADEEKQDEAIRLLNGALDNDGDGSEGGAVMFTATKKGAEKLSKRLQDEGWKADFFHGGRTPDEKREVQDAFLRGELRVIAATNAFGMGVDKADIRLVIHMDTPGSLENYLQEAGRAGRDREPAHCILLFDPSDLDAQFSLSSKSRVELRDVSVLLTALRKMAAKGKDNTLVMTSGEILGDPDAMPGWYEGISTEDFGYDTKVKMIVSSLERAGKIERGDNRTSVIQGKVLVRSMEEAHEIIDGRDLPERDRRLWLDILGALLNAGSRDLLNTDQLSDAVGVDAATLLAVLKDMREAKLLNHDMNMTAFVHHGVQRGSMERLEKHHQVEEELIRHMEETDPEVEDGAVRRMIPRLVAHGLKERGCVHAHPAQVQSVLTLWRSENLVGLKKTGEETQTIFFRTGWGKLRERVSERKRIATAILNLIVNKIPTGKTGKNLLVSFQSQELSDTLGKNKAFQNIDDLDKKRDAALHGLHQLEVITLQSGLAVFRPAMSLMVTEDRARFLKQDFAVYEDFFKQKILQVHIMGKYAALGVEAFRKAMALVKDYFILPVETFVARYFPREKKLLELPTSMESHTKIVSSLRNAEQERIVTFGRSRDMLVLAGPGSGKTRCIVHRIAYLIRVKRIPVRRILALAFNRSAAGLIRQRLKELIGRDAIGVRVYTYHALAMRITGKSLIGATKKNPVPASTKKEDVFERILHEAVELLRVESGEEHGVSSWRDRLLGGLSYILVDEYQDINAVEYDFLSLLAGRSEQRGEDGGQAPTLMAVGDDDQNIYAFTGANVQFIRRFKEEYDAEEFHLTTNFRSAPAIVEASNQVIGENRDRMKTGMDIVSARSGFLHVGDHEVRVIETEDTRTRLKTALDICARELAEGGAAKESICMLCRTNGEVNSLLQLSRSFGIPMRALRRRQYDLTKTPEFLTIKASLRDCVSEVLSGAQLRLFVDTVIDDSGYRGSNIWTHAVRDLLDQYLNETNKRPRPVEEFITYLYDAAREGRGQSRPEPGHVVAATLHAVKGLEFSVVVIPGQPVFGKDTSVEEERRLYYVGMTRAEERLYCLTSRDCPNPFLVNIAGNGIRREACSARLTPDDALLLKREWLDLDLSDVVIDFPGYSNQAPRIQPMLAAMEPGDTQGLSLVESNESMYVNFNLLDNTGRPSDRHVAKLSQKGVSEILKFKAKGLKPSTVTFMASQLWLRPPEKEKDGKLEENWFVGLFRVEFEGDKRR